MKYTKKKIQPLRITFIYIQIQMSDTFNAYAKRTNVNFTFPNILWFLMCESNNLNRFIPSHRFFFFLLCDKSVNEPNAIVNRDCQVI